MKLKTRFTFYHDNSGGFIGAYEAGSMSEGKPVIIFNMDAILDAIQEDNDKAESFKDILLSTLTHEFCHSLQEWLGKEFDELEVERILGAYNKDWNVFNAENSEETDPMQFNVMEFLELLDKIKPVSTISNQYIAGHGDCIKAVKNLFGPMLLWHEAAKKNKENNRFG